MECLTKAHKVYWFLQSQIFKDVKEKTLMVKKLKSKYTKVPVGYTHYLRSGAGPHKDKKKESSKMKCRGSLNPKDP